MKTAIYISSLPHNKEEVFENGITRQTPNLAPEKPIAPEVKK